jgi:hypothetical protein
MRVCDTTSNDIRRYIPHHAVVTPQADMPPLPIRNPVHQASASQQGYLVLERVCLLLRWQMASHTQPLLLG